ncbi:winged helix-turn-helix domain-containing protein [Streptomyces sp. NPDC058685]|uniref:winged helix-turn-helix domain-containing protein n=1 Tax=Streptomyces sp. NPDC058685 TaxID=3346598 RepID=UPI003660967B
MHGQLAKGCGVAERLVCSGGGRSSPAARRLLLAGKRESRAGNGELSNDSARGAVLQAMRDYTAAAIGQSGVMWSRASVRTVIRLVYGMSGREQGVSKCPRWHGFTPQRPARRSYRQQGEAARAWLDVEHPAIAARPWKEKAELVRADQCGLRSDKAPPERS